MTNIEQGKNCNKFRIFNLYNVDLRHEKMKQMGKKFGEIQQ